MARPSQMFALEYTLDGRTERHLLATGDTTVGRSPVCDIVIHDPSISRRHARFRVHGDHCLLSDLGGRNGTFLNGELVAEAAVTPGDMITLGRFTLVLRDAVEAGLALSSHEPLLDSPSTVAHRVDLLPPDTGTWRLSADSPRLFGLVSTVARRLVRWSSCRDLMEHVVDAVFEAVPVQRAFLLLPSPETPALVPHVSRTRDGSAADGTTISRAVIERVVAGRLAILSTDEGAVPAIDEHGRAASGGKRWFMAVPLWSGGRAIGALYADNPETEPLSAADLDLLHGLALCAAAAIEQARDTDRLLVDAGRLADRASADSPTPRQALATPAAHARAEPTQKT